jgi:dihydrofolate synthase/folylpolyglutamate synthase
VRRTLVLSVSRDKDVRAIVATLVPHFDRFVVTQYRENPRAVPAERLAHIVSQVCGGRAVDVGLHASPPQAWQYVVQTAVPGERVCIVGSFYLAAEMRPLVAGN